MKAFHFKNEYYRYASGYSFLFLSPGRYGGLCMPSGLKGQSVSPARSLEPCTPSISLPV